MHPRARNIDQLAELYSCADVFLNPVHETNFPTTNIEALACGTPIVVYDTGGCPDAVSSETGLVVPEGGIDGLVAAIQEIKSKGKSQYSQNCISRVEQNFNHTKQFKEYINLFESVYSSDNAK